MGVPSGARICMRKRWRAVSSWKRDHHLLEHLEGLLLVGDERVLLRVAAEADALLEVVHVEEVLFPEAVEDGEHDDALVVAHLRLAEDLLLDVVALASGSKMVSPRSWRESSSMLMRAFELQAEDLEDLRRRAARAFHCSGWALSGANSSRMLERMVET